MVAVANVVLLTAQPHASWQLIANKEHMVWTHMLSMATLPARLSMGKSNRLRQAGQQFVDRCTSVAGVSLQTFRDGDARAMHAWKARPDGTSFSY